MADKQGRKWQITINNPQDKGLDHDAIKLALDDLRSLDYYCVASWQTPPSSSSPFCSAFSCFCPSTPGLWPWRRTRGRSPGPLRPEGSPR